MPPSQSRFWERAKDAWTWLRAKMANGLLPYRLAAPTALHDLGIELTFRCNLSCVMCPLAKDKGLLSGSSELSVGEWTHFIDDLVRFARPGLTLTGAEPMLYEGWHEVGVHARRAGLRVTVQTNGTFLEEYSSVVTTAVDVLHVSVDGTEDVHDRVRQVPGSFSKTIKGLETLHRSRSRPSLHIFFTLNEINYTNLAACLDFFRTHDFNIEQFVVRHPLFLPKRINFQADFSESFGFPPSLDPYEIHLGKGVPIYRPSGVQVDALLEQIHMARRMKGMGFRLAFFPDFTRDEIVSHYGGGHSPRLRRCVAPWVSAAVGPNGDFYVCPYVSTGNIKEQSLKELWHQRAVPFRLKLWEVRTHGLCRACPNLYLHG